MQSQQATQGWLILDSTYNKTSGKTCAAQPHGTDSQACAEQARTFIGHAAGQGCTDTLVWLSAVSGSTLLSLISIISEDVRGEAGLISLSKAPCQLGNLCTGLRCTNRCVPIVTEPLSLPAVSRYFIMPKNFLLPKQHVIWEQSGVIPQFLMLLFWSEELQGSYRLMYDAFSYCMCLGR